jgi:hypothetical protein
MLAGCTVWLNMLAGKIYWQASWISSLCCLSWLAMIDMLVGYAGWQCWLYFSILTKFTWDDLRWFATLYILVGYESYAESICTLFCLAILSCFL